MARRIKIFDTTLRDGEQSPGCSMNLQEKLKVARQLERLKVDVIEAGFAIASPGDFNSVKAVADTINDCAVASLARALTKDIDAAWDAIKNAKSPRIHTFLATSDLHMQYKLRMSPDEVLKQAVEIVKYAKKYCSDIEFSAEDASRSNPEFLYKVLEAVIDAGATTINVPDTVGYSTPKEFSSLIIDIRNNVKNIDKADLSVHCHNDLGLAVSNSLAAADAGATQLECTINGIGERAGNAALEEIVMNLQTRKDLYDFYCNVDSKQIYRSSKLVSTLTGVRVQPNKAIVGENAFAHESGIHQHGVLANKETYEIMTPESIGLSENKMVLGKHSGKHAFEERIKTLGYILSNDEIIKAFQQFKELADKKKIVSDRDIEALIEQKDISIPEVYSLKRFFINSGNTITSVASVQLINNSEKIEIEEVSTGDGPVDAAFKAIEKLVGISFVLDTYDLRAVTGGKDAQGEVIVKLKKDNNLFTGRGISTDVIEASIKAYLNAINKLLNACDEIKKGEKGQNAK
ncbi:MAG: 2-isopropylmalate synthase [Vulcanibacillus sp.]